MPEPSKSSSVSTESGDQGLERVASVADVLNRLRNGESLLVDGAPGSGKTTLAKQLAMRLLDGRERPGNTSTEYLPDHWAPVLVLTPDRRRAADLDASVFLGSESARVTGGSGHALGAHRLIRSINSYAHLVAGLWQVEREDPLPRLEFLSGAREDAQLADFLSRNKARFADLYSSEVLASPYMRMETRNLIARSGEVGLLPEDLVWLGEQFNRPLWQVAGVAYAELAGEGDSGFYVHTRRIDTARLPRVAAHLLSRWDQNKAAFGVQAVKPVPGVLIVDDIQDLPASAVPLLAELARHCEQVVLLSSPLSATAEYRGGRPDLGQELASVINSSGALDVQTVHLRRNLRSVAPIAAVSSEVRKWLEPAVRPASTVCAASGFGVAGNVTADLTATDTKRDALVAQRLRRHHLIDGIDWDDMAVIVRNASMIEPLRRRLARLQVPLHASERPVQLGSIPITAILLRLLELGGRIAHGGDGAPDYDQTFDAAMNLLRSPLVNVDPLEMYRLVRDLKSLASEAAMGTITSAFDLLEIPQNMLELAVSGATAARRQTLQKLRRARRVWGIKEQSAGESAAVGIWRLWDAAGVEGELRERALAMEPDRRIDREIAGDQLDSVIALMRKADLWQQEQLASEESAGTSAFDFAKEILSQTVASDSLVKGGLADPGVHILTASQAAGQQWSAVCIVGPQLGSWPQSGSDSMADLSLLRIVIDDAGARGWPGEAPIAQYLPDLRIAHSNDRRESALERRKNEARLFLSAVTRSRSYLHFVAVETSEQAASPFLTRLSEAGLVGELVNEDGKPIYAEADSTYTMPILVGLLRRRAMTPSGETPDGIDQTEAARLLALLAVEGVAEADPSTWSASGGLSSDSPVLSAGPIRLSPSSVETAKKCPLKGFLNSVQAGDKDALERPVELSSSETGSLIHEIAEEYPRGPKEPMLEALRRKWDERGFGMTTHWEQSKFESLTGMVERLAVYVESVGSDIEVKPEISMRFQLDDALVNARIDRLEINPDGTARVIDIKTGAKIPASKVDRHEQLLTYQLVISENGFATGGAGLLQLADDKTSEPSTQQPLAPGELDAQRESLEDLAKQLGGVRLEAIAGEDQCRYCQFKSVCPAQEESTRMTQ